MNSDQSHGNKFGLIGVSLTPAKTPQHSFDVEPEVRKEIEALMEASGYLDNAPFEWVTLALRYGLKNEEKPHYQKLDREYGDLPLSIEVNIHGLLDADENGPEELKQLFMIASLKALIDAGKKYNLPVREMEEFLKKLTTQGRSGAYKNEESAQSARGWAGASIQAEQEARYLRKETGEFYETKIRKTFPTKGEARKYKNRLIERFRRRYGKDALPGNKTDR